MKMNKDNIRINYNKNKAVSVFINYYFVDEYEPASKAGYKLFLRDNCHAITGYGYCSLRNSVTVKEAYKRAYRQARRGLKRKMMAIITKQP